MKPYDKSNSFVRRVTKRVSELIPGTTWMNMLLGESQSVDDNPSSSSCDNDDQPPVKKLCSSNNNRTCVGVNPSPANSIDNHRSSHVNIHLPEISAITCMPSTSKPKSIIQSNCSLADQDNGNSSSFKRKSDLSNIKRQYPKTITFNFASSTPTLDTPNKQPHQTTNSKTITSDTLSTNNDYFTPTSLKQIKQRENESQSMLTFRDTTSKQDSSPSFRWDTFVNYGELSERQKLFAQKSPLNCSRVMYGGNSARSNLSKILANSPAIHKKSVIPISPITNSEIRTTSSILLSHISTKDKKIEENKFIIQPKVHMKHKADQKPIPLKVETTINIVNTSLKNPNDNSLKCSSIRDTSRKLRANISKKVRGIKSEELKMPTKVDLPNVSLAVPVLPSITLSKNNDEDNEFLFNQPLTIEQFSLQIAEKSCKKQKKKLLKNTNSNMESIKNDETNLHSNSTVSNPSINDCALKTSEINENISIMTNNKKKDDKVSQSSKFVDDSELNFNKSQTNFESKLDSTKPMGVVFDNAQIQESNKNNEKSDTLAVEVQKISWVCDCCWVPNNSDKTNCVSCQTPRPSSSEQPLKVTKSSTWTCETCWVPNKSEINSCVACQTQKPGAIKKVEEPSTWKCDACWVVNKTGCTSCISCGTGKPGLVPENKSQPLTQFKFGFNNNSFDKSSGSQFKFGFNNGKTVRPSSQFQFGSTLKTTENGNSDTSAKEFNFGVVNNKADEPSGTFKFGIDNPASQPIKNSSEIFNSTTDKPSNLFKFGDFNEKSDQPDGQFKFGLNQSGKPITQFKFGLDTVETEKSVNQNLTADTNEVTQSTNESQFVTKKKEISEKSTDLQNSSSEFKFGDSKQTEKPTSQVTFGSIETNCNNSNILIGHKNEGLSKGGNLVWDKKDNVEIKSVNFGTSQTVIQPAIGNTNTTPLVNGHSHSNETLNEDPKQGLIKTSQLFNFGSLSKQDQNLPDDQKKMKNFTFGSVANDKPFVSPLLSNSSFSNTIPVFGATNSIFGSVPTTSTQGTSGSTVPTPRFTFGSIAPPTSNSFFSNAIKDDGNKPFSQTSNSNVGFSFGTVPSTPVFSVANAGGGLIKPVEVDDQFKSTPNNVFNQSNTKQTVNLDPNAPISINFTGGTTTQFTANPETAEPTKRKILKPVRRIR